MILYLLAATVVPTKRTRSRDTKQTSPTPSTEIGEAGSQASNFSLLGSPLGYSILKPFYTHQHSGKPDGLNSNNNLLIRRWRK